jgi:hypothetical protein
VSSKKTWSRMPPLRFALDVSLGCLTEGNDDAEVSTMRNGPGHLTPIRRLADSRRDHERCVTLPSISTEAHHAVSGVVNDLSTGRTLARRLRRRRGVVRGDTHAPRADHVVEVQLPPLKLSRYHDGTPMAGLRISRSSLRKSLLMARVKLPNC